MAAVRFASIVVVLAPALVHCFPSLRERIPNGRRVRCPDGVSGCAPGDEVDCQPESVCHGVGHATCTGGTLPLNPFGAAFKAEGSYWSKALCEADTDGDGLTNGEELGDPCCIWQWGDDPSDYMRAFPATHPGFANSAAEVAAYSRPECSETAPRHKGTVFNRFNDGEEQRWVNLNIKQYTVPNVRTTYKWFAFNFDDDSQDIFHVVFAEALVDKAKMLHHYVIRGCPEKFPQDMVGMPIKSSDMMDCKENFGGWAPGSYVVDVPAWMGVPVGRGVGVVAFAVQVHYNNLDLEVGVRDSSGMRFWYTPTLRSIEEGKVSASKLSVNQYMVIPPGKARYFVTRTCKLTINDAVTGEPAVFNVVSNSFHAHLLGREMYAEVLPAGNDTWLDLGSETAWHFDDQYHRDLTQRNITLRTGDILQTTCIMDSRGKTEPVPMGEETIDEMCWAGFSGYPKVTSTCEGPFWTGELQAREAVAGLAVKHPAAAAETVLDGKNALLGGTLVKLKGELHVQCDDSSTTCSFDSEVDPSFCNTYLGFLNAELADFRYIDVCCKSACSKVCPEHPLCTRSPEEQAKGSLDIITAGTSVQRAQPWCLPSWGKADDEEPASEANGAGAPSALLPSAWLAVAAAWWTA